VTLDAPRTNTASFIDPQTLMRIKSLQLRARIVVRRRRRPLR